MSKDQNKQKEAKDEDFEEEFVEILISPRVITKPKRGKDIKCFEDLPPEIQETIDRMSVFNGKIDRAIKIKRTATAIKYQHLFPDSFEPQDAVSLATRTGVCIGKPGDEDVAKYAEGMP